MRATALLLAMASAIGGTATWAQDLPGLVLAPIPKSTPGYAQFVDPQGVPIEWHKVIFNQIDRICLRHGADIPAIEALAKAEGWTGVAVDSRPNQVTLTANGGPIERSSAWEFRMGPQRYFVAVTPQPSFSLASGAIRPHSKSINKCEIKLLAGSIEAPSALKAVLRSNQWSIIATPQAGAEVFGTSSSDREITVIEDYSEGAAIIEVIVM